MRTTLMLVLALAAAGCGSERATAGGGFVPAATAAEVGATAMADTGPGDSVRPADTPRVDTLPAAPASPEAPAVPGSPARGSERGGTMGRGMMGVGMMGGRAGATGGGIAPAAAAQATPDTGACPQVTQSLVDAGRSLFTGSGNCASCHGANGTGGPLGPDLADTSWLDTDGSYAGIAALVRSGVAQPKEHPAPMPPKGGADLNPGQVCSVAGYVYSLSHKQ